MSSALQQRRTAWLLLVPMLGIMAAVTAWPLLRTVWLSFTDTGMGIGDSSGQWVGLDNFVRALSDADFRTGFGRTLYFTLVSVGLELLIGILVALLLNQKFRGRFVMRALLVLPWALPTIVNAMMWRLIYNPEYGSLNALLTQLGILSEYRSWLGDPDTAMNMVILADVWKNYPIIALIALAALQTVPTELYEAARLDGANAWNRFWHITLPSIAGPLIVALVLRTIEQAIWPQLAQTEHFPMPFEGAALNLGGVYITAAAFIALIVTAAVVAALTLFLSRTRLGIAMRASADNQLVAQLMGAPVSRIFLLTWSLAAVIGALAAILLAAQQRTIDITYMDPVLILAFVAAVLGGLDSLPGALLGGVAVGVMENWLALFLAGRQLGPLDISAPGIRETIIFAVFILVLLLRPQGLLGKAELRRV